MADTTEPLLFPAPHPKQRQPPPRSRAWGCGLTAAVLVLLLLLLAASDPPCCRLFGAPPEPVELTLLAGATEKGAVCLDGTPPGYHLKRGSGDGASKWLVHLEGGGWCSTVKDCSNRKMSALGSSNFMKPILFGGAGILGSDQQLNPDFYNWNKVYVRYCDGASFSGDTEGRAQDGSILHFRGLHIYEAVIDELMRKGLANATQALLTGCSAGGLATILHCDDFSARFPREVSVKCLADAGFFLDVKDISGVRSFWSVYDGVVHLQNVREVLPKECLANKEPTECFFPAEIIKSIRTPMFILNSGYDSWQIQNVLVPVSSSPDKSWLSCKNNIRNCNSTQIQVLDGFRNSMVNNLKVVEDKGDWGMFIDSCFTHCQTLYGISWNSPISPRLGNNTIAEAVGDWYSRRRQEVKQIDCEYPCNPTCSSLLPT
ncbi:pectin acetylesterase 5-like [Lolium rigidum]|uniref:pectin acetylesterase 5-like n=1 Tax=Lolium rigidum TaxID=89674 RepID=UPI001F5C9312|nr:pectin acetylesterase 5-like [Lolium rigidum]